MAKAAKRAGSEHLCAFLAILVGCGIIIGLIAVLEAWFGFKPPINGFAGGLVLLAFAAAIRYLVSIPLRLTIEHRVRKSEAFRPGIKTVRLLPDSIVVLAEEKEFSISLERCILKAATPGHSMMIETGHFEFLIIPPSAFGFDPPQKEFATALRYRLRKHARVFWTTRF